MIRQIRQTTPFVFTIVPAIDLQLQNDYRLAEFPKVVNARFSEREFVSLVNLV